MFGIGPIEFAVVLVVALLVMGPKKLPDLARTVGKGLAEFRRASTDLKRSLDMELPSHEIEDVPGPAQASSPQAPPTPGTALEEIERGEQLDPPSTQGTEDENDDGPVPISSAGEELSANDEPPAGQEASASVESSSAEESSAGQASSAKPVTETPGD